MSTEIPKSKIGPYALIGCIGRGANARVYEAEDFWGKRVAIKLLNGEIEQRRLKREIEAYSHLEHPSLPELLDHGHDPECGHYLVTRLIEGKTLREFASETRLSPDAVMALSIPLLEGLNAMHSLGFVHRDLKPENLMVTNSGQLVIVDLGLTMRDNHSRLTDEGTVAGSVPYMSPEQIEGGKITRASDVWSLGVILYELLCGQRPFERPLVGEEVAAILRGSFDHLDQIDRRVPEGLAALIHSCLRLDPAKRPTNAADLISRMKKLMTCDDPGAELALLLADPEQYLSVSAQARCSGLKQKARAAIEAKDSFAAFGLIDRALAYCPDDDELTELVEQASARCPRDESRRRFRPWAWAADLLGVLLVIAAILFWPNPAIPEQPPAAPAEPRQPAALHERTRAAEQKFYLSTGKLAQLLVKGAKAQTKKEGSDPSEADKVALDLMGNFAEVISDVGSNGSITVNGQEASAEMLGNLLELFEMGLEPKTH
jgi:serine/threonine-protein kinase